MTQLFNGWRRTAEIYTVSQKTCHFVSFFHDVCTNGNRKLRRRTELFLQRSENHPDSYDALNISALFVLLKYIVSHKKTSHLFVDVITALHCISRLQQCPRWLPLTTSCSHRSKWLFATSAESGPMLDFSNSYWEIRFYQSLGRKSFKFPQVSDLEFYLHNSAYLILSSSSVEA